MSEPAELFPEGTQIGAYVIGKPMMVSNLSTVYQATPVEGGSKFVFKCIRSAEKMAESEINANKVLSGGPFLAVGTDFQRVQDHKGEEHWGYFVPYYNGGDLLEYRLSQPDITEDTVREMAYRVLCAIRHMHGLGWVHRNLKLENIFISGPGDAPESFLGDFSLSAFLPEGELFTDFVGTRLYSAPELLRQPCRYGAPVDMWAFGVTLYAMLNCALPFPDHNEDPPGFYSAVIDGKWDREPMLGRSDEAIDLIDRLLNVNPDERLTADQALEHPFFARRGCPIF